MTTATLERVTTAEFLARDDQDDYELIDGELKERCMGADAVWVAGRFYKFVEAFAERASLGLVFPDGLPLEIFGSNDYIPRPDGAYISFSALMSRRPPRGSLTIPPDLVIEVVSPSDNATEIERKVWRYLDAGVATVWVAYPDSRSVHIYRHDGSQGAVRPPMNLEGENILPGFSHPVADFFPAPVPE